MKMTSKMKTKIRFLKVALGSFVLGVLIFSIITLKQPGLTHNILKRFLMNFIYSMPFYLPLLLLSVYSLTRSNSLRKIKVLLLSKCCLYGLIIGLIILFFLNWNLILSNDIYILLSWSLCFLISLIVFLRREVKRI